MTEVVATRLDSSELSGFFGLCSQKSCLPADLLRQLIRDAIREAGKPKMRVEINPAREHVIRK